MEQQSSDEVFHLTTEESLVLLRRLSLDMHGKKNAWNPAMLQRPNT